MNIGIDRKTRCRQKPVQGDDVGAVQAEGLGELEPTRDPSVAFGFPVVVDKPAPPFAPQRRILAARDQARVLRRDHGLIIIAVEGPGLDLPFAAFASMQ